MVILQFTAKTRKVRRLMLAYQASVNYVDACAP